MAKRKFEKIEMDAELKRWCNSVKRGSEITADVNFRRMEAFCSIMKTDPHAMLELSDKDLTDLIDDFVTEMENKFSGNYISSILKGVKSWLAFNNKPLIRKIRISDVGIPTTLKNEKVPSQDELKRILQAGNPRERACCLLIANSGLRPESIGDYHGNDGLTIGDLPEMEIENGEVNFKKIPTVLNVRSNYKWCLFCYIFSGSYSLLNIGFKIRTYVLRGYFDTQLLIAESKIGLPRDYRVFWMVHSGTMEAKYTTDKILNWVYILFGLNNFKNNVY